MVDYLSTDLPSSPKNVKDDVINNASGGAENFASLSRVEGAGHLVSLPYFAVYLKLSY